MMGLSHAEPQVSGLGDVLTAGRWFTAQDRRAVLISERLAESLGLDPRHRAGQTVSLWGMDFEVDRRVLGPQACRSAPTWTASP